MKTTKLLICAVAVAAAFASVNAQGQTLSATLIEINPAVSVTGTFNGTNFYTFPAGLLDFQEFDAFCVEPLEVLSYGQSLTYQIQNPSFLTTYNDISLLVGGYLASSKSAEDAAAVQWAIWEVTNDASPFSLLDGAVKIAVGNADIANLANQYLTNRTNFTPAALTYLTEPTFQNVVSWNAVPEPASAGLAALSGLLMFRRRRI